jgi:hypothetical protein
MLKVKLKLSLCLTKYQYYKDLRWAGYVTRIEGDEKYKTSVRKTEGKKPFWSPGHGWDDNIKIDDVGGLA